jgi:hypothetical protein
MLRASAEGRNPKMAKTRHAPGQITRVHSRNRLYVLSSPLYHHSRFSVNILPAASHFNPLPSRNTKNPVLTHSRRGGTASSQEFLSKRGLAFPVIF